MKSRRSSVAFTSVRWVASSSSLLLVLVLSTSLLQIGGAQGFDCDLICFSEYALASSSQRNCALINYVLRCYYDNQETCEQSSYAPGTISIVINEHEVKSCDPWLVETTAPTEVTTAPTEVTTTMTEVTTATTEVTTVQREVTTTPEEITTESAELTTEPVVATPPTPPPPSCPMVPPFMPIPRLASSTITPTAAVNRDCMEYSPQTLQHCSLFGLSSLRPFRSYRYGLEVCNIPGSWYLLRHHTVTVEVEGVATGRNLDHTILSKVNVTFYRSANCLGETKSYVVTLNDSLLPQNFTDDFVPNNCSANLQLITNSDGTSVSLLASWINTTVIVRKYGNRLGVTIQVPGHLGFESEGLCRGCPAHANFNISGFNDRESERCHAENWIVLYICFTEFSNRFNIHNASYADICTYHLWRGNSTSFEELSLLLAVSYDAELLPNRGNVPPRNFEIISHRNMPITGDLCHPTRQTNSSVTTREPTNRIDTTTLTTTDSTTQRVHSGTGIDKVPVGLPTTSASQDHQRRFTSLLTAVISLTAFVVQFLQR